MKKISQMKDASLLIKKAHLLKRTHQNERRKIQVKAYYREVLEPGIRRFPKSFQI